MGRYLLIYNWLLERGHQSSYNGHACDPKFRLRFQKRCAVFQIKFIFAAESSIFRNNLLRRAWDITRGARTLSVRSLQAYFAAPSPTCTLTPALSFPSCTRELSLGQAATLAIPRRRDHRLRARALLPECTPICSMIPSVGRLLESAAR